MTSHVSPDPVTLNALGMDNGLAPSRFRALCTGPPHTVQWCVTFLSETVVETRSGKENRKTVRSAQI